MTMSVKQGGAWNTVTGLYVKQGGAWQSVQTGYVKQGGVWNIFYSSGLYNGSITAGMQTDGINYISYGYASGVAPFGSASPSTFTDGKTFQALYDYYDLNVGGSYGILSVSGFASDPGQTGYFTSITSNSTTYTAAGAAFYSYGSGIATWTFPAFGFVDPNTYSVVVV